MMLRDTHTGRTIKAEGKVSELLQEAMAQPADSPARQLAETLIAQQETALVEQGLELGSQYQISHAEQAQLATETANNALSEQAIGELGRMLKAENFASAKLPSSTKSATIDERKANFKSQFDAGKISTRISPQKQARHIYITQKNTWSMCAYSKVKTGLICQHIYVRT